MHRIYGRGILRPYLPFFLVSLTFVTLGTAAVSQEDTTYLTPPRGEAAAEYQDGLARSIQADVAYIDETNVDFLTSDRVRRDDQSLRLRSGDGSGMGVIAVMFIIAMLLFLFLKFGGAGGLFQADPNAVKKPRKRAKAWGLTAADQTAGDILAQIRAMKSRREALILLLRHCLLTAADETDVFFLRADTEREALARLPNNWRRFSQLESLLRRTELVHYGGREITDTDFDDALKSGAQILMEAR